MTNVNDLLRDHVTLTVDCMDRIYLNGYIPNLQVPGQLVNFSTKPRGHPILSPALLGKIREQFAQAIKKYAEENQIPLIHFEPGQRKDDVAAEHRRRFDKPEGVVFIGVAQKKEMERLPMPLTAVDRQAGYGHRLPVWQVEISRTQVFDDPVRGRQFFEAVIRENLDLGRPDRVQLAFDRKIIGSTPGRFRTRVIENGVNPNLYIEYKKSLIKQYFKEGRALRTETIINDPKDFRMHMGLSNLPFLQQIGWEVNRRLLDVQRVSPNCHLSRKRRASGATYRHVGRSTRSRFAFWPGTSDGLASGADFARAQCFRHRDLRSQVADLLGIDYSAHQLSYDLRRL
jgi:hypothetical protein